MSKTWKWILGIVLGLVILAGAGFAVANFFGFGHMAFWGRTAYYGHPMMDDYGFHNRGPIAGHQNFRHPMMVGRGFYPLGGLLRLIFPLAVLGAVGYFAYKKGRKDGAVEAHALPEEPITASEPEEGKSKK